MLSAYNAKLRNYVVSNHYMDTLAFHTISGADIIDKFGYKECPRRRAQGTLFPLAARAGSKNGMGGGRLGQAGCK